MVSIDETGHDDMARKTADGKIGIARNDAVAGTDFGNDAATHHQSLAALAAGFEQHVVRREKKVRLAEQSRVKISHRNGALRRARGRYGKIGCGLCGLGRREPEMMKDDVEQNRGQRARGEAVAEDELDA